MLTDHFHHHDVHGWHRRFESRYHYKSVIAERRLDKHALASPPTRLQPEMMYSHSKYVKVLKIHQSSNGNPTPVRAHQTTHRSRTRIIANGESKHFPANPAMSSRRSVIGSLTVPRFRVQAAGHCLSTSSAYCDAACFN